MNLVRHELGLSKTESRFPTKGTCLAIYSRAVNAQAPLERGARRGAFPGASAGHDELKQLFAAYVEAKQAQNVLDYDDLLLYWAQMAAEPAIAEHLGGRFDHVLVDEYQDTNRLQASILLALKPDGRGLTVVGDDAQSIYSFRAAEVRNILDFPTLFAAPAEIVTLERNYRSTEPILAAANAVIGEAPERFTKNLWTERQSAERPRLVTVRDEADQANYVAEQVLEEREAGTALKHAGGAVSRLASQRPAGDRADPPQHPLRQVRRPEIPRRRACQGRAGGAALRREPARPRRRLPRAAAAAGHRPVGGGRCCSTRMAAALDRGAGLAGFRPPQRARRRLAGLRRAVIAGLRAERRLAGRSRAGAALVRAASRAHPRGRRRRAAPTCCSSSRSPPAIPRASAS